MTPKADHDANGRVGLSDFVGILEANGVEVGGTCSAHDFVLT